jgi:hypothetical protein
MSKVNIIGKILLADDKQLEAVEKALEVKLMEEALLNDGATKVMADPAFEAGAAIFVVTEDEQQIPVPVNAEGEAYELEDGRQFTVAEEGIIAEVMEAGEQEEPSQEEPEEEVAMDDKPEETPVPKVITESVVKEMKFSEEAQSKIDELEAKVAELSKQEEEVKEEVELSVEPITHNPEAKTNTGIKFQWGSKRSESAADRVMRKLSNK